MKNQIGLFFYKLLIGVTTFFLFVILYNAILKVDVSSYISSIMDYPHIIYLLGSFLLITFFLGLSKTIDRASVKKKKIIKMILVFLLLFFQCVIIFKLDVNQVTDSYATIDQALTIVDNLENGVSINFSSYFYTHVNNDLFLIINVFLVKIYNIFSFISLNRFLAIVNTIMIDLSIVAIYKLGQKIRSDNFALKLLALNVMNPLNYLLIYWSYTCTYSTVFVVLAVLIGLYVTDKKLSAIRKTLLYSLLGFVLVFGYYLRPIVLIPIVALVMYLFFKKEKTNISIKKLVMMICCILSFTILSFNVINFGLDKLERDTSQSFPVTHYIMMGLHGSGTHNSYDPSFTRSYTSQETKIKANIEEIKKTLKEYALSGLVEHFLVKLPITWSDGTVNYSGWLVNDRELSSFYDWFVGDKSDFIKVYSQCFRIATLFLAVVYMIDKIRYKKYEIDNEFLIILTIFGAIFFYLLWEAKSVYSLPFIPILLVLSCFGLEDMSKRGISKKVDCNMIRNTVLVITLLLSISLYPYFTQQKNNYCDYSILNRSNSNYSAIDDIANSGRTIKQTFHANKKFNKVLIRASKLSENSNTSYIIELRKGTDVIKSRVITSDIDFTDYITISFDEQEEGDYSIVIYSEDSSFDTIKWFYINGNLYKYYEGDLTIDEEESIYNLAISVYYGYENVYTNKKAYLLFTLILLLFEIYLFYKINQLCIVNEKN